MVLVVVNEASKYEQLHEKLEVAGLRAVSPRFHQAANTEDLLRRLEKLIIEGRTAAVLIETPRGWCREERTRIAPWGTRGTKADVGQEVARDNAWMAAAVRLATACQRAGAPAILAEVAGVEGGMPPFELPLVKWLEAKDGVVRHRAEGESFIAVHLGQVPWSEGGDSHKDDCPSLDDAVERLIDRAAPAVSSEPQDDEDLWAAFDKWHEEGWAEPLRSGARQATAHRAMITALRDEAAAADTQRRDAKRRKAGPHHKWGDSSAAERKENEDEPVPHEHEQDIPTELDEEEDQYMGPSGFAGLDEEEDEQLPEEPMLPSRQPQVTASALAANERGQHSQEGRDEPSRQPTPAQLTDAQLQKCATAHAAATLRRDALLKQKRDCEEREKLKSAIAGASSAGLTGLRLALARGAC